MRITQVKNDLLSIGKVTADREFTLIALGGLTRLWKPFITTIFNDDRIPGFDELLARCSQEETRMIERDKSYNGNEPIVYSTHAKRRNVAGPSNSRGQGQGSKKGFKGKGKGRCYNCNKCLATMLESILTRRILQGTTTTTIKETSITIKEKGMLLLPEKEIIDLPRGQEMPGVMKIMLWKIR